VVTFLIDLFVLEILDTLIWIVVLISSSSTNTSFSKRYDFLPRGIMNQAFLALLLASCHITEVALAFVRPTVSSHNSASTFTTLRAAPARLPDNADGVLYVNDRCIDCSTCSHFAPSVFSRTNHGYHVVHTQPSTEHDIDAARAALAACPVAAIRVETMAQKQHRGEATPSQNEVELAKNLALSPKFNGRELPFPRPLTEHVWYLGHHNERSFGATPYLAALEQENRKIWVMIDTPRYCQSAVDVVTQLTGTKGPDYLFLTHVDDTADHGKWKDRFPLLQRIFHAGDLGRHNWLGDTTLEHVEILLPNSDAGNGDELQAFDLSGNALSTIEADMQHQIVLYHTPGHSPGSMSLFLKSDSVLFTGDTLGYTERTKSLTGFPRFGNNRRVQATTLERMEALDWDVVAPGHGHARNYKGRRDLRAKEMQDAKAELASHVRR
jgi:glyoxylase-like metal-dependent hydrolase (beta-lactamase superfamily II)/ferredoxin